MSIETKYTVEALSISKVSVDTTNGGKTLEELGVVLNPQAHRISLQAIASTIYVSDVGGSASTDSFELLGNGSITLDVGLLAAKKLKFVAGGTVKMNVLQLGDA